MMNQQVVYSGNSTILCEEELDKSAIGELLISALPDLSTPPTPDCDQELVAFRYKKERILGKGSYGKVYLVADTFEVS